MTSISDEAAYFAQFSGEVEAQNVCEHCGQIIPEGCAHMTAFNLDGSFKYCDLIGKESVKRFMDVINNGKMEQYS